MTFDPLGLTGATIVGTEIAADQGPLTIGNHLRWSVRPDLGFPAGGFRLERKRFHAGEFLEYSIAPDWEVVAETGSDGRVGPPADRRPDVPLRVDVVRPDLASSFSERFGAIISDLRRASNVRSGEVVRALPDAVVAEVHAIRRLCRADGSSPAPYRRRFPEATDQRGATLRPMSVAQLGMLDPEVAMAFGLYGIDLGVAAGDPVLYRVTAFFNRGGWPVESRTVNDLDSLDSTRGIAHFDGVELATGRSLMRTSSIEGWEGTSGLVIDGAGGLPITIIFPYPVTRCVLVFAGRLSETTRAEARHEFGGVPASSFGGDTASVTITGAGGSTLMVVRPRVNAGPVPLMSQVTLSDPTGDVRRLVLTRVDLVAGDGPLQTLAARALFNGGVLRQEARRAIIAGEPSPLTLVDAPMAPVPDVPIGGIAVGDRPGRLGHRGVAIPEGKEVAIDPGPTAPPAGARQAQPVRLHVRRLGDERPVRQSRPGSPAATPVLPQPDPVLSQPRTGSGGPGGVGERIAADPVVGGAGPAPLVGSVQRDELQLRRNVEGTLTVAPQVAVQIAPQARSASKLTAGQVVKAGPAVVAGPGLRDQVIGIDPRLTRKLPLITDRVIIPELPPLIFGPDARAWDLLTEGAIGHGARMERICALHLDGNAGLVGEGRHAVVAGGVAFVPRSGRAGDRRVAEFRGGGITLPADVTDRLSAGPPHVLFRCHLALSPHAVDREQVLLSDDAPERFRISATRRAAAFRVTAMINGRSFVAERAMEPANERGGWHHVQAFYDGARVLLWVNERPILTADAALGPVGWSAGRALALGRAPRLADQGQGGRMMEASVWALRYPVPPRTHQALLAHLPLDGGLGEWVTGGAARSVGATSFVSAMGGQVLRLSEGARLEFASPSLAAAGPRFALDVALNAHRAAARAELLRLGDARLALVREGAGFRLEFSKGTRRWQGTALLPANAWRHVRVAHAEGQVIFAIDGRLADKLAAPEPLFLDAVDGLLAVGGGFSGDLAAVSVWAEMAERHSPVVIVDGLRQPTGESEAVPPTYVDRAPRPDRRSYAVQGVDLFARTGAWSAEQAVIVQADPPVAAPAGLMARPRTLRSVLHRTDGRWTTDRGLVPPGTRARDLHRAPATLIQGGGDPAEALRERVEIMEAGVEGDGRLSFAMRQRPMALFRAEPGDRLEIDSAQPVDLRWFRTATQAFFDPEVSRFDVHLLMGPQNLWAAEITDVAVLGDGLYDVDVTAPYHSSLLDERLVSAMVGGARYKLQRIARSGAGGRARLTLAYGAYPIRAPRRGEQLRLALPRGHSLRPDLAEIGAWPGSPVARVPARAVERVAFAGPARYAPLSAASLAERSRHELRWIPADGPVERQAREVVLTGVAEAGVSGGPPSEATAVPDDYAPGMLLTLQGPGDDVSGWVSDTVLWHYRDGRGTVLIVGPQGSEPRPGAILRGQWIFGQTYKVALVAPPLPAGTPFETLNVGVVAYRGDKASKVAGPAIVPLVARRMPPVPPAPAADIDKPDVQGRSRALVTWPDPAGWLPDSAPGVKIQIGRATDAAVVLADAEARRRRLPPYRPATGADLAARLRTAFGEDPTFDAWRAARFPSLPDGEIDGFFVEDLRTAPRARAFWRAWSEHFYPALPPPRVHELAGRPSADLAFALVNGTPADGDAGSYADEVPGDTRSAYFYRLRTVDENNTLSLTAGPPSPPAFVAPSPKRTEVAFTEIVPGDRSCRLRWHHAASPAIVGYRLYRAPDGDNLQDLRWFGDDPAAGRLVRDFADRRARVDGADAVFDGEGLGTARILGVYLLSATVGTGFAGADGGDPIAEDLRSHYRKGRGLAPEAFQAPPGVLNLLASPVPMPAPSFGPSFEPASGPAVSGHVRVPLARPAPDGAHLVVVAAPEDGATVVLFGDAHLRLEEGVVAETPAPGAATLFDDGDLHGRRDYLYRVTTVDTDGQESPGSKIVRARSLEIAPALPPVVTVERVAGTDRDAVRIAVVALAEPLQLALSRMDAERGDWVFHRPWAAARPGDVIEFPVERTEWAQAELHYRTPGMTYGREDILIMEPALTGVGP